MGKCPILVRRERRPYRWTGRVRVGLAFGLLRSAFVSCLPYSTICRPRRPLPSPSQGFIYSDQIRRSAHRRLRQLLPRLGQPPLRIQNGNETRQSLPVTIGRKLQADPVSLHHTRQRLPTVLIRPVRHKGVIHVLQRSGPSSDIAAPPAPPAPSLSTRSLATRRLRRAVAKYSAQPTRRDSTSAQDISPASPVCQHCPSTIRPDTSARPPRQSRPLLHADHSPHDECQDAAAPT